MNKDRGKQTKTHAKPLSDDIRSRVQQLLRARQALPWVNEAGASLPVAGGRPPARRVGRTSGPAVRREESGGARERAGPRCSTFYPALTVCRVRTETARQQHGASPLGPHKPTSTWHLVLAGCRQPSTGRTLRAERPLGSDQYWFPGAPVCKTQLSSMLAAKGLLRSDLVMSSANLPTGTLSPFW